MVLSSVLGFPRIGTNREVKKAVEAYWAGKISAADLQKCAADVRKSNWKSLKDLKVDLVPSGDFTLYDHVLDHSTAFNVIPKRYVGHGLSDLDVFFALGRGRQVDDVDVPACEMKKWFDTNYHYVVPELSEETEIKLVYNKFLQEYNEAKDFGIITRPVVLGPISYLVLGKSSKEASPNFQPISLLPKILPIYKQLLSELKDAGAVSVQVDEPVLVLDIAAELEKEYAAAYAELVPIAPKIVLTTYFACLGSNVDFIAKLPVDGLHIDLVREPGQLDDVLAAIKPTQILLSLGVVSGRNVWKANFTTVIQQAQKAISSLGEDRVIIATSSSLMHVPVTLAIEKQLTAQQRDWFSFALEKVSEVATIAAVLSGSQDTKVASDLAANIASIGSRREFERTLDDTVQKRVDSIKSDQYNRKSPFAIRKDIQAGRLKLPKFPTTTLGSYPQTREIRHARAKLSKGEITNSEYEEFIKQEINFVVREQEKFGLDILVHGEPERNDMVQYFGERLNGFVFTENGWIQSYGSRYVRPPIIVSDVMRPAPMTVKWISYAQSITGRPMKGMLTGPVTILNWSFPREDVPRRLQCQQLALSLRDEVHDLEVAGIAVIQVDEPAIREGLPLRRADWDAYLEWASSAFKLTTAGVGDETQIHSHFCYSDFGDIFSCIQHLDADVISIEFSKSDMKLLQTFREHGYANKIGPGVYDVHSPRVPSVQEITDRLREICSVISDDLIFVNPDCGLKTRGWRETEASLCNLVAAARRARTNT